LRYGQSKDHWQVYFDTNRLIKETFTAAAFVVPEQHHVVRSVAAGAGIGMAQSA
jgi:small conductance mechanosensitive channel